MTHGDTRMNSSPPNVLYYISGHGFGHARRCAETIRVLTKRYPQLRVHVRTMASPAIFADLGENVRFAAVEIDRGAIEKDACTLDWPATLDHVRELIAGMPGLIGQETAYIREHGIGLIIADAPFMAGYVAQAAGVPCFAQANFLWDWIYAPFTDDQPLLNAIAGGYRRMAGWLRLPFPHECDHFRTIQEVPFISSPLTLGRYEAINRLGLMTGDARPKVLVGMRGGIDAGIYGRLRELRDRFVFIAPTAATQGNVVAYPQGMRFWDVMQVCDVVVSKPGHGIVTDCATLGVGLLWPARNGFPEDAMILREGARYFRAQRLPSDDFASGNWGQSLDELLAQPRPAPATNTDGAQWMADWIGRKMGLIAAE